MPKARKHRSNSLPYALRRLGARPRLFLRAETNAGPVEQPRSRRWRPWLPIRRESQVAPPLSRSAGRTDVQSRACREESHARVRQAAGHVSRMCPVRDCLTVTLWGRHSEVTLLVMISRLYVTRLAVSLLIFPISSYEILKLKGWRLSNFMLTHL